MEVQKLTVTVLPDGRMDQKNASLYIGCSTSVLEKMRMFGTGPRFVKRCNKVFYFQQDLDEWIRKGFATTTAQARVC